MAFQYGQWSPAPGYNSKLDLLGSFGEGQQFGKGLKDQQQAPETFAQNLPPLSEFGLDTPPEQLKALFANPETRPLAIEQVKAALDRRAQASDPLRQLQLQKAQVDLADARRGPAGPAPTAEMRNYQMSQQDPKFLDFIGKKGATNAPAEVQQYLFYRDQEMQAGREPLPYLDFRKAAKASTSGGMTANERTEIFDAEDAIAAGKSVVPALQSALTLNDRAFDGPFAAERGSAAALVGVAEGADTLELQNIVTAQALDQLKAVFGGMPTEGERKILLDIQGSVGQPREVRKRIYERAIVAAERRTKDAMAKAEAIRSGSIYEPGYGEAAAPSVEQAPGAAAVPEGLDPALWEAMTPEERALWN